MEIETNFLQRKEEIRVHHKLESKRGSTRDGHEAVPEWLQITLDTLAVLEESPTTITIWNVPTKLRRSNEDAYTPRIASIGFLHRGNPRLQAMEEHKWRYALDLIHRTTDPNRCMEHCGKEFVELAARARVCYPQNIELESQDVLETMLIDGCFLLELFFKFSDWQFSNPQDQILNNAWIMASLRHDLTLLENQIPFSVLEHLFRTVVPHLKNAARPIPYCCVTKFALRFFQSDLNLNQERARNCSTKHLLDLLHGILLPSLPKEPSQLKNIWGFKQSATELVEDGIRITRKSGGWLLDIDFESDRIEIPPLSIHERTESLLSNLIAYEQCSLHSSHHITSYAMLLRSLIQSPRDASFLKKQGIITSSTCSDDEVQGLFRRLCEEVVRKDFYFAALCEKVSREPESCWPWCWPWCWSWCFHYRRIRARLAVRCQRYWAILKQNYFQSPWSIIAVIYAFFLLALTVLQTLYTMLAFYQ